MASQNMTPEDVMNEDTFYRVLADSDIQPFLFEPEYTAEEKQQASEACVQCILVHVGSGHMLTKIIILFTISRNCK